MNVLESFRIYYFTKNFADSGSELSTTIMIFLQITKQLGELTVTEAFGDIAKVFYLNVHGPETWVKLKIIKSLANYIKTGSVDLFT